MKKLLLPLTARPHKARQAFLIQELQKQFELHVWEPIPKEEHMATNAILYTIEFSNYLKDKEFDAVIIRGDRYEMLGIAMIAVYKGMKVIHIEGGDLSGVVDNKVRHAITHLADFHFCTNKESHQRLLNMGVPLDKVWNFGSLDVEYAHKIEPQKLKEVPYIMVAYHAIAREEEKELDKALAKFDHEIIKIGGNKDYGKVYGSEEFAPDDYINLMRYAKVLVGNSSSLIKEASILKTGVVLVGDRQQNRLMPRNVVQVPCKKANIIKAIYFQLESKYEPSDIYYQKDTSKKITKKLKEIL